MTNHRRFALFAAALAAVMLIAVPTFAARGSADFTTFVVIGDSYGAGVESGSLNQSHQQFSWPAIVAKQAGVKDFQQPLVSFPGIGSELQLVDVIKYPPVILPAAGAGQPINLNLPRPYNNLAIPGATVTDVNTLTGKDSATSTAKAFAQFILRGQGTAVDQALAQRPTFIAIWIGGNDVLGAVLSGTPAVLTPVATFTTQYNAMLDKLIAGAPSAGMVVGNLPTHIAAAPIASAVPPFIINPATKLPVLGQDGNPIFYVADLGGGTFGQLPPGSFVLLSAAGKLGTGFGIPSALKTVPPFNQLPDVGKPLADTDVLTPTEIATIEQRARDLNGVITAAAAARNIPVADISGLFDRVQNRREFVGPFSFTSDFITGGFFSLDGFHLSDIGYTLFADEFIKAINAGYNTHIPAASITTFLADNGAFFPKLTSGNLAYEGMPWDMSNEAADQIRTFAPEVPRTTRFRTTTH